MLISDLANSSAIPVLEASLRFAAERQKVIAHNIANASTPDFRPTDADPARFAQVLREAVKERRERTGGEHGSLRLRGTRDVQIDSAGNIRLKPREPGGLGGNILFHDRNNRDMERLMQANAENVGAYRLSAELLRSRYELIKSAIAERA